ncbi:MAG: tRNA pseudouridine(38-40) synthase TruA [Geminicoccaceae bacterium]|nr:tRNA pseudouridine(38-40) synthase TruA [Geminicoccaceae bacterium]
MRRWRLLLEYDGGPFVGWQRQASGLSVQALLEEAVARLAGETVTVVGGGRTDAGVHALGQVAHLDLEKDLLPERLMGGLNAHLRPHPVAVLEVRAAAPEFHARFAAIRKSYIYRILDRRAPPTLERGRVWHVPRRLDVERMHEAAQALVGRHDFSSFRASECQAKSPLKTLDLLHVRRAGPFVEVRAVARSFLHHQVRNMVGTLVQVGLGKRPLGWAREVLEARDRTAAGPTAPAFGLYLERIDYPPG